MSDKLYRAWATRVGFVCLLAGWCTFAAIGIGALLAYEFTPAATQNPESRWPAGSSLSRDAARPTLVMFLHPHCPCSGASVRELAVVASRCHGKVCMHLVFVRPDGQPPGWEQTGLWNDSRQIAGASVAVDDRGQEAERFRASASGETFLYAPDGRLLFHGGITVSRGHDGQSPGRLALIALIQQKNSPEGRTPVYGCPLSNRPTSRAIQPNSAHAQDQACCR